MLSPPFPGQARDQIIHQIMAKEPLRPRQINKRIPVDLETICLKALEKDPDARYQSAGQLAEDLRRYVNRYSITARRAGHMAKGVKWVRRRPAVAGLTSLVLLVALVAVFFARRSQTSAGDALELAIDNAITKVSSGDYEAAEQAIQQAQAYGASPGWVDLLNGFLASEYYEADAALALLNRAVERLPDSVAAKFMLASAHWMSGSLQYFDLVAEVKDTPCKTFEDFFFKGIAYTQVQYGTDEGMKALSEAIRLRPRSVPAYAHRADAGSLEALTSGSLESMEIARADAGIARTMMPNHFTALAADLRVQTRSARLFDRHGLTQQRDDAWSAAATIADALKRFKGNENAHRARALYFMFRDDLTNALPQLRKAYESRKGRSQTPFNFALALHAHGHNPEAKRVLDAASTYLQGWHVDYLRASITADLSKDGRERARQIAEEIINDGTWEGCEILYLLGYDERAREITCEVRSGRRQLKAWPPWMPMLDYVCGAIEEEELLRQADSYDKQCHAHFWIGLKLLVAGQPDDARKHFETAVAAGNFQQHRHAFSLSFREHLKANRNWPPWIDPPKTDAPPSAAIPHESKPSNPEGT